MRKKNFTHPQTLLIASFAAGVLLATAFLDLLPEAEELAGKVPWLWALGGVIFLFLLEKSVLWYHHHDDYDGPEQVPVLITVGDTIHNFIDGMVIAAGFMATGPGGVVTALAVAAHEIPHEMADFGVLLSKGWSKSKTVWVNIGSAAVSLLGSALFFFLGSAVEGLLPYMLAFAGGMFMYLALSDLIPELHHCHGDECEIQNSWGQVAMFSAGIGLVWGLVRLLE